MKTFTLNSTRKQSKLLNKSDKKQDPSANEGLGSLGLFLNNDSKNRRQMRQVQINTCTETSDHIARSISPQAKFDATLTTLKSSFAASPTAIGYSNSALNMGNPFYCDTSILNSTVCGRKQLQMEDRARSLRSMEQAQRAEKQLMSSLSLDRDNLANYLKKRVSTTAPETAFDYSKLDRSCTAPYYGDNLSPSSLSPAKVSSFHAGKYANPQTRKISSAITAQKRLHSPQAKIKDQENEEDEQQEEGAKLVSYVQLTHHQTRMKSPIENKKHVRVQPVESKTLAYENYMAKMIKEADEKKRMTCQTKDGVVDNFIEVKVNKTSPVIFGLSQNYRAMESEPDSDPVQHDYKRHKMKKSQLLVRSVVKFIEQERKTVQLSNYEKSFSRLKENVIPTKAEAGNADAELAQFEKNLVHTLTSRRQKDDDNENDDRVALLKEKFNRKDEVDQSEQERLEARREEERREAIRRGIAEQQDKQDKINIKQQIRVNARRAKLLHRHSILAWAETHKRDELESVKKYKECLNDPEKIPFRRKSLAEIEMESKKVSTSSSSFVKLAASSTTSSFKQNSSSKPIKSTVTGTSTPEKRRESTTKNGTQLKKTKKKISQTVATVPAVVEHKANQPAGVGEGQNWTPKSESKQNKNFSSMMMMSASSMSSSFKAAAAVVDGMEELLENQSVNEEIQVDKPQFKSQALMKKVIELGNQNLAIRAKNNPFRLKNVFMNQVQNLVTRTRGVSVTENPLGATSTSMRSESNSSRGFLNRQRSVSFASSEQAQEVDGLTSMYQVASSILNSKRAASKLITILGSSDANGGGTRERKTSSISNQQAQKEFIDGLEAVITDIYSTGYF